MAYARGFLNKRVTILKRADNVDGDYGRVAGEWQDLATFWAAVDFSRGVKSMREGALDAYDTIMVRTDYLPSLTKECRLRYDGSTYHIDSFHADYDRNETQITATELQL